MAEKYIKASECEKYFYDHLDDNGMIGAMNAIDEIPAADVKPVKRGKWIRIDYCIGHEYICSVCKCENDTHPRFCPNCGAVMRND